MSGEHTPWTVRLVGPSKLIMGDGKCVATVHYDQPIEHAYKMAAAQEMLEALEEIHSFAWTAVTCDCKESLNELQRRIDQCRAARAKARGES